MVTIKVALMMLAFILLCLEALKVQPQKVSLGWFGLALWLLSVVLV